MANKRTRIMRVDEEFYYKINEIEKNIPMPKVELTRQIAKRINLSDYENIMQTRIFRRRKKGTILDLFFILFVFFITGITLYISYYLVTQLSLNPIFSENTIANQTINQTLFSYKMIDQSLLFLLIGAGLASAIFAYFIQSHPLFFIISLILFVILFFITAMFTNTFVAFLNVSTFENVSLELTNTTLINQNMPLIILFIGVIIIIALYAKSRGAYEGQM